MRYVFGFLEKVESDPPVPPGAIKLSYSARLNSFVLRLCDKDSDFMEMKIIGAESDCIYNANQRMILRAHLRGLTIDDLRDITLYPKVCTQVFIRYHQYFIYWVGAKVISVFFMFFKANVFI